MSSLRHLQLTRGMAVTVTLMNAASMAAGQATATSGDSGTIATIDASVSAIDRDAGRYTVATHELEGYSTEGGELRGFFESTVLHQLAVRLYGESGRVDEQHYYSGDQLVFVRRVTEIYDQRLSGRVRVRAEHALYFGAGKLIRQIRTQTPSPPGEDLAPPDPDISQLLVVAKELRACAPASRPPTCVAPAR